MRSKSNQQSFHMRCGIFTAVGCRDLKLYLCFFVEMFRTRGLYEMYFSYICLQQ